MKYFQTSYRFILLILVHIFMLSCNTNNENFTYYKFVYDYPRTIDPLEATSEVEIWLTRLLYRNLFSSDRFGHISGDLAESIEQINELKYLIKLKKGLTTNKGTIINSDMVKKCFDRLRLKSNTNQAKNLQNILVINDEILEIHLFKKNIHFQKSLTLPLLSIYDYIDGKIDSTSLYQFENNTLYLKNELIKIYLTTKQHFKGDPENIRFDTALDYTNNYDDIFKKNKFSYRLIETWGFTYNHNTKFNNLSLRRCVNDSIDRLHLTKNIFINHIPYASFQNNIQNIAKCVRRLKFEIQIPTEILTMGEQFCNYLKSIHDVRCIFLKFTDILQNIKNNKFEVALLSLTVDAPYVESTIDLLNKNSNFSIINKTVSLPEELTKMTGLEYLKTFEEFLFKTQYFTVISQPIRTIYASSYTKYDPSLINPAYDPIESIKR